jgi:hypothetical protein
MLKIKQIKFKKKIKTNHEGYMNKAFDNFI